jgi:predicted transcriptional regulator
MKYDETRMSEARETKTRWTLTIDPELARRLDEVCAAREENRSEVVERIIQNAIVDEEKFVEALESPLQRAIMQAIDSTPGLLAAISKLVLDEVSPERLERMKRNGPRLRDAGRRRQQAKKVGGVDGKEATA